MDMIIAGYRMYLGLAAKAAKSSGENDAIVILVERCTTKLLGNLNNLSEPLAGKQSVPIQ